jgi:DNA-binding NtrC family response regulator
MNSRPLQIAVADDEPIMRDYLKTVLERLGHIVLGPVENGLKLVELCRECSPDLVITDIRMSDLNGDEALRQIHQVHAIPCIVVSAYGNVNPTWLEPTHAKWTFLGKPFRKNDLRDAILQLMS